MGKTDMLVMLADSAFLALLFSLALLHLYNSALEEMVEKGSGLRSFLLGVLMMFGTIWSLVIIFLLSVR